MMGQGMTESSAVPSGLSGQPASSASEWNLHEHVAPAIELEAQQLIDHAGSPDLAKQAIDAASHHQVEPPSPADELAQQFGFVSAVQLLESSRPLTAQDGTPWWVTSIREEGWLVWNEQTLAAPQQFPSLEALNHYLGENAGISPR